MKKFSMKHIIIAFVTTCAIASIAAGTAIADGNDFAIGELRVDLDAVNNARDYQMDLLAGSGPSNSASGYTTAWIGVELDNQPGLFGFKFTQVGLNTDQNGAK
jgi:hypothetical protein